MKNLMRKLRSDSARQYPKEWARIRELERRIAKLGRECKAQMLDLKIHSLTVHEAAGQLRVSLQQVRDLIEEGKLRAINVGTGTRKFWRIPVDSFEAFKRKRDSLVNPT